MSHWLGWAHNRKLLWIRPWQKPLLWGRPILLTKMCWKVGLHKASHHSPHSYLCPSQHAHGRSSKSFCISLLWRVLIPVGDVRWGFPFLVGSQRPIAVGLMWRTAEILRSQTFFLRVKMRYLFFFAVLYSVQSSCKCVIWMSVWWAYHLYRKHLCFPVKYFQKAVHLLALYPSSHSSMKKTNHEKSLCFKWLHWNNFVLVFLKGERNAPPSPQL